MTCYYRKEKCPQVYRGNFSLVARCNLSRIETAIYPPTIVNDLVPYGLDTISTGTQSMELRSKGKSLLISVSTNS